MKASQVRRFVISHSGPFNADLWRGAGQRKFSILGLSLILLTFHFSPALVSAQDLTTAKKNCDTAALARSVWGDGVAARALLAELDADCATRFVDQYTTERDEAVVRMVRKSSLSVASASATYCYDHIHRKVVEELFFDQYAVSVQKRWCATSTAIVGTPERFKWVDIIYGGWRLNSLSETHNYFISSAVHKTNVIAYMEKGSWPYNVYRSTQNTLYVKAGGVAIYRFEC